MKQAAETIVDTFISKHGYVPTEAELVSLYAAGELQLSDDEEDFMSSLVATS